jgi:hypothetical protein
MTQHKHYPNRVPLPSAKEMRARMDHANAMLDFAYAEAVLSGLPTEKDWLLSVGIKVGMTKSGQFVVLGGDIWEEESEAVRQGMILAAEKLIGGPLKPGRP